MENNQLKDKDFQFSLEEYKQCWNHIQFLYQQRDRTQRFYFIFVLGGVSVISALLKFNSNEMNLLPKSTLLLLIIPIILVGILCLSQLISLRISSTFYHKALIIHRRQIIGKSRTILWLNDDKPTYYYKGFNFFTLLIVMIVTSIISASGLLLILIDLKLEPIWYSFWSIVSFIIVLCIQFLWYKRSLKNRDREYKAIYPKSKEDNVK